MSQSQQENHSLRRPSKIPRLEDFIYDEVPSREIPAGQVGYHLLSSLLGFKTVGLALVRAAHLGSLRMCEGKFLKLAFYKHEAGAGLRGPTAEEMMAADRKLWDIIADIADLVNNQKWSLNDALAEVVDVRADMASLLQPRPLPPKVLLPMCLRTIGGVRELAKARSKAAEKAAEKAEASSRFGSQSRSLVKKWISTYASNGEQRVVCMRYSTRDGCTSPTCRYEHLCPVLKPDGFPCLSAIRPGNTKVEAARGEEASFPGGRVLASSINRLATMLFVHAVMVVQPFLPRRGLWSMMAAGRVSCPVPVCPPALPQPPMPKLPGIPQSCQCRFSMCARVCVWL